jgi:hypothetical protein
MKAFTVFGEIAFFVIVLACLALLGFALICWATGFNS